MSADTPNPKPNESPPNAPPGEKKRRQPALVGDGYDAEPLLTAEHVGLILQVPTKSVYELPIPKVRISKRRIRYRPEDVEAFINKRASKS